MKDVSVISVSAEISGDSFRIKGLLGELGLTSRCYVPEFATITIVVRATIVPGEQPPIDLAKISELVQEALSK